MPILSYDQTQTAQIIMRLDDLLTAQDKTNELLGDLLQLMHARMNPPMSEKAKEMAAKHIKGKK